MLSKKAVITRELTGEISSDYIIYLAKNGVSTSNKKPNSIESLEFLETEQYQQYKKEKMSLIKKLLDNGANPELFKYLLEILEYVKDDEELRKLLEKRNK